MADKYKEMAKKMKTELTNVRKLAINAKKALTANEKLLVVANKDNKKLSKQATVAKEKEATTLGTTNKQLKELQDAVSDANNIAKEAIEKAIKKEELAKKEKQRTQNKIKELEQLIIACKSEMGEFEKLIQSTTDEEAAAAAAFQKEMDDSLHNKSNLKF